MLDIRILIRELGVDLVSHIYREAKQAIDWMSKHTGFHHLTLHSFKLLLQSLGKYIHSDYIHTG